MNWNTGRRDLDRRKAARMKILLEEPTCVSCGAPNPTRQDPYGNDLCMACGRAGVHGSPMSLEQVLSPEDINPPVEDDYDPGWEGNP